MDVLDALNLETHAQVLTEISDLLLDGQDDEARRIAHQDYPFQPVPSRKGLVAKLGLPTRDAPRDAKAMRPNMTHRRRQSIWLRDGYRDRYSGTRLVHPAALEMFSVILRPEFPFDNPPNGKYSATHICMWELWPAIDHVLPLAIDDSSTSDSDDNLVSTSALVNQLKSSYRLEDLGWPIQPRPATRDNWEGLSNWVVEIASRRPRVLEDDVSGARLARWVKVINDA